MSWRQVPAELVGRKRVPIALPWLLAVVPLRGVLVPFGFGDRALVAVAVVLGVTAVALRVWPPGLPVYVLLATLALGAVTAHDLGWHLSVVAVVPLGFWMIALGSSDPPYRWVPDGRLFRPCLIAVAAAAALMVIQDELWTAQRLVAVACAMAVIVVILPGRVDGVMRIVEHHLGFVAGWSATLDRILSRWGRGLGKAVGIVVMVPVSMVVMVSWTFQRLVGFDPLGAPTSGTGWWVRRAGGDPEPHRMFSGATEMSPATIGTSVRRAVSGALTALTVLAVLVVTIPVVRNAIEGANDALGAPAPFLDRRCVTGPDPAMQDDPDWPRTLCDTADYSVNGRFSAVTTYTMADHESATVNVRDGVRETWRAPECGCRRVRMWMFGGSAAFGWWQRDDLTIASQLAKLAWDEGIALDIELRANPGWVLGQEQRLFTELSVTEDEPPDLALFYDGGNELERQRFRNDEGRGADESPTSYAENEIDRLLSEGPFPWYAGELLDGGDTRGGHRLPGDQVARHAMNRYLRDLELARRSTASVGVEPVFVWQPLLVSAGPQAGNPDALTDEQWRFWEEMLGEARPMIPEDVVDLADVLDGFDTPVFKDLFHHNTEGSAVIAAALLDELRPRLRTFAGD